jgi:chromosome segregation ATPase
MTSLEFLVPPSNKLDNLQQNLSEQKRRHQAESEETRTRLHVLEEEKKRMTVEKGDLERACEEFRKESESILEDYNTCAQRLKVAEEAASRMSAQHQKDLTEQARMRERISLLEQSRKEQDDKLNHMDQQV